MALFSSLKFLLIHFFLLNVILISVKCDDGEVQNQDEQHNLGSIPLPHWDKELLEVALNLEYLETEFFLIGSTGCGLDKHAPDLVQGGPPPIGARKAFLDPFINDIMYQFSLEEIGHLRAVKRTVKGFPRPALDLSISVFAEFMNSAFGRPLFPPFDPYKSPINFLLAAYVIPYVGLTGYVGANPRLSSQDAKRLVAGLLAVESAQDAVIRTLLYERRFQMVYPYGITVMEFTNRISELRNKLGKTYSKDEGIVVEPSKGAEGKTPGNIIVGNKYSIAYYRKPEELLRIVYATGDEKKPGGFFPKGADGDVAQHYLKSHD